MVPDIDLNIESIARAWVLPKLFVLGKIENALQKTKHEIIERCSQGS